MCWWIVGGWWPGLLVMGTFMVICMLMMGGMMRSMTNMWGFDRTRSWSGGGGAEHAMKDGPVHVDAVDRPDDADVRTRVATLDVGGEPDGRALTFAVLRGASAS